MERFQGPLNSCLFGEHLEVNCLEEDGFVDYAESLRFIDEEEEEDKLLISSSSLDENMPFLQMLQSVEYSQQQLQEQQCFFPLKEPTFQTLLRFQHMKNHNNNEPWEYNVPYIPQMDQHHKNNNNNNVQATTMVEPLESCVTHYSSHSPVKSESYELQQQQQKQNQNSTFSSCVENKVMSYECNQEQTTTTTTTEQGENNNNKNRTEQGCSKSHQQMRKKRKRTRPAKNKEDVENQRMTHIAVERNRRRQMNDHLSVLRSLMPPSYIQRGDQASIIGGAIDFVKELEQLLQSLEAQKRMRNNNNNNNNEEFGFYSNLSNNKPSSSPTTTMQSYGIRSSSSATTVEEEKCGGGDEVKAESKSGSAEIEVTLIQTHVNLKIHCQRKQGQLVKAIVALEDLRLSILHLNITTSSLDSVLYSLNLKIEEGCKLSTANEIAEAVHHIFNFING